MGNKVEITKVYKQDIPKSRFVGICYKNSDRVNGAYGGQWEQWHAEGKFGVLEKLLTDDFCVSFEDSDAYIGLMKNKAGEDESYFEYWIGMFLPAGCEVPEGYDYIDFDNSKLGVCWLHGNENELFFHEGDCYQKLMDEGMKIASSEDGGCYMFERYGCPRFTKKDAQGNVVLDLCFFVE